MESSQYCLSPNTQVPYFHIGNPKEKYVFLSTPGESTVWLRMTTPITIIQLAPCQTQRDFWQENLYSAKQNTLRLITVCRRLTNGQWKCSHSISLADLLRTEDLHNVSAGLCLFFQVSSVKTWTQLSKLTNVLSTWMTSELQSTTASEQSLRSEFARKNWNQQQRSAILESHKSNSKEKRFHSKESHHKLGKPLFLLTNWDSANRKSTTALSRIRDLMKKLYS